LIVIVQVLAGLQVVLEASHVLYPVGFEPPVQVQFGSAVKAPFSENCAE
jgi:hypothetical protein